ncbi:MAG: DUF4270 domain-containing protein [Bacteroidales bacterium]
MNFKYFFLLLAVVTFAACSDDMSLIGSSIQPDSDKVDIRPDTLLLSDSISTFDIGSIYALSNSALLGNLSDKTYGETQCDFMAQFNCTENFNIPDSVISGKDSLLYSTVTLLYRSYAGNPDEPMQASVYQLNNKLSKEINSDVDASKYCNKSILLGRKGYVAKNVYAASGNSAYDSIQIKLSNQFTKDFHDKLRNNRGFFQSNESFANYFPGIYVTNNSGSGSIVSIESISLNFFFKYKVDTTYKGQDSVIVTSHSMKVNEETYLVNRYKNSHLPIPAKTDNYTYIKSPAGLFNHINIPIKKLAEKVGKSRLNGAKLTIKAERPNYDTNTLLSPPSYLMLIKENELADFFKNKPQFDARKHAYATFNSSTNSYTFTNISKIFTEYLSETGNYNGPDAIAYVLLPVSVNESTSPVTIRHANSPTGIKLLKDGLNLSLVIAK